MTPLARAVLDFLESEQREDHDRHPGGECEPCAAKKYMRDMLAAETDRNVPEPRYCTVSDREARETRLLLRFGSLMLAKQRLESDARAYTVNQQMAEAARTWAKYHTVKAELLELEPHLAGIRWEQFQ